MFVSLAWYSLCLSSETPVPWLFFINALQITKQNFMKFIDSIGLATLNFLFKHESNFIWAILSAYFKLWRGCIFAVDDQGNSYWRSLKKKSVHPILCMVLGWPSKKRLIQDAVILRGDIFLRQEGLSEARATGRGSFLLLSASSLLLLSLPKTNNLYSAFCSF